jgi:UDP:flavonoid glycosyltransferase YjiC (YdhE family)
VLPPLTSLPQTRPGEPRRPHPPPPPQTAATRLPYTQPLLELVNSNFVTEPPRPVGPMIKYTGPILPSPARALPDDLEAWVAGAGELGTVFVSFGSTLAAPLAASRTLLRAMAMVPDARFVWRLSEDEQGALAAELADAPPNVRVEAWVPQNDLLGHPNVTGFVTQVLGAV